MTKRKDPSLKRVRPWNSPYNDDIGPQLYELRKQGKTMAQCARELNIAYDTLMRWRNDEDKKDFANWYQEGHVAFQAFLEDKVMAALSGDKITPTQEKLLSFTLRTHYREEWAEKRETSLEITNNVKNIPDNKLSNLILDKLRKLGYDVEPQLEVIEGGLEEQ